MARTLVKTIDIDQLNSDISGINEVPDVGLDDQVVKKFGSGATDYQFETILEVPSGGTTGQILTKTATGYEWQTPTGGGMQINTVRRNRIYTTGSYTIPSGGFAWLSASRAGTAYTMATAGAVINWNSGSTGRVDIDSTSWLTSQTSTAYVYIAVISN